MRQLFLILVLMATQNSYSDGLARVSQQGGNTIYSVPVTFWYGKDISNYGGISRHANNTSKSAGSCITTALKAAGIKDVQVKIIPRFVDHMNPEMEKRFAAPFDGSVYPIRSDGKYAFARSDQTSTLVAIVSKNISRSYALQGYESADLNTWDKLNSELKELNRDYVFWASRKSSKAIAAEKRVEQKKLEIYQFKKMLNERSHDRMIRLEPPSKDIVEDGKGLAHELSHTWGGLIDRYSDSKGPKPGYKSNLMGDLVCSFTKAQAQAFLGHISGGPSEFALQKEETKATIISEGVR